MPLILFSVPCDSIKTSLPVIFLINMLDVFGCTPPVVPPLSFLLRFIVQECRQTVHRSTSPWHQEKERIFQRSLASGKITCRIPESRGFVFFWFVHAERDLGPVCARLFPRLNDPTECPANGSRREDCDCRRDYAAEGFTTFSKVRLDISKMHIISKDVRKHTERAASWWHFCPITSFTI